MKGMTLARCFRVLDSIVLGILIYLGALAFKRVVKSEKNQLAYCIQVSCSLAAWHCLYTQLHKNSASKIRSPVLQ